jgi:hypothetical protein
MKKKTVILNSIIVGTLLTITEVAGSGEDSGVVAVNKPEPRYIPIFNKELGIAFPQGQEINFNRSVSNEAYWLDPTTPSSHGISKMRWRAAQYEPYMLEAAKRYNVDPRLLWTIAYLETRFRPELISPKGARGMMQFMPGTASAYGLSNPHDPHASIVSAARYVRDLYKRFGDRVDLILASYNAGEGAVEAYLKGISIKCSNGKIINPRKIQTGGIPPYEETRKYVSRGLYVMNRVSYVGVFNHSDLLASGAKIMRSVSSPLSVGELPDKARVENRYLDQQKQLSNYKPVSFIPRSIYALSRPSLQGAELTHLSERGEVENEHKETVYNQSEINIDTQVSTDTEQLAEYYYDVFSGQRFLIVGEQEYPNSKHQATVSTIDFEDLFSPIIEEELSEDQKIQP